MTDQQPQHGTISDLEAAYATTSEFEAAFQTIDQVEGGGVRYVDLPDGFTYEQAKKETDTP